MVTKKHTRLDSFDSRVTQTALSNGIRVFHIPLVNDPRFLISVTLKAGARYEGDIHGVAHYLEHMMFRGSKRYPSFKVLAKAFERLGGEWNAATGYEHTEYYYSGHIEYWRKSVELFADFFMNPKLLDMEIEREVIKKELYRETNELNICTDLDYHMQKLFWPSTDMDRQILGSLDSINKIKKKHLNHYRQTFYKPENMIICVAGEESSQSLFGHLQEQFGHYKTKPTSTQNTAQKMPSYRGPRSVWLENSDSEYQLQWSYIACKESDPIAVSLGLLCRILADGYFSKLGSRLRETLGLVYSIHADLNLYSTHGSLDIYSSVTAKDLPKFCQELKVIIEKLVTRGPSLVDLKLAKKRALIDLELSIADPERSYFKYAWSILEGRKPSFSLLAQKISMLTQEDLHKACRKVFQAKNLGVVLMGPKNKSLEAKVSKIVCDKS